MIKVVAALIEKENKYLIAKRSSGDLSLIGKWEFPGGKVEPNEDEFQAIEREIYEEFELNIKAKNFITKNIHKYSSETIGLRLIQCDYISGNIHLHDHSEYAWISKQELLTYDFAPADIPLIYTILIDEFVIGNTYTREEIQSVFKCSLMSGMAKSNATNTLVLVSKHNKTIYEDKWENDILLYTGQGMSGNQKLSGQNKTLFESETNGIKIYLLEVFKETEYTFQGEVHLASTPYTSQQLDEKDNLRTVWIFPIKKINNFKIPLQILTSNEEKKEKSTKKMSNEKLNKELKQVNPNPSKREAVINHIERNSLVSEKTKRRANGKCELCGEKAPFTKKDGSPYLETHHIITLAENGPDQIYNTVALCPNCHRKIHILKNPKDLITLTKVLYNHLLSEDEKEFLVEFDKLFS